MQAPLTMQSRYPAVPELAVTRWFNTANSPTLAGLGGEVVVIEAFQMLCPGCVSHGLPQAKRIQQAFGDDVIVLGAPLRVRAPRGNDPCFTRSVSTRVSHHVPGRRRHPLPRECPAHHNGPIPATGHPEPWLSSTGPDVSASTRLDRSTTSPSAPPSPVLLTNLVPSRRPTATPTSDVLPQPRNPAPSVRRRPLPLAVRGDRTARARPVRSLASRHRLPPALAGRQHLRTPRLQTDAARPHW